MHQDHLTKKELFLTAPSKNGNTLICFENPVIIHLKRLKFLLSNVC